MISRQVQRVHQHVLTHLLTQVYNKTRARRLIVVRTDTQSLRGGADVEDL